MTPSAETLPALYSFRRCPYAMRARLAIAASGAAVELREVVLRDKPEELLSASPKGTVPVLIKTQGEVIDESYDIMWWALDHLEPDNAFRSATEQHADQVNEWVNRNDTEFKPWLDRYKYADRFPEHPMEYYRNQCENWFKTLNERLAETGGYIATNTETLADLALLPFIRQCAHVDKVWFDQLPYNNLQRLLKDFLSSNRFMSIMSKYPRWQAGDSPTVFAPAA